MRRKVGTERYSVLGYPCLYLGNSSYVCWEEMNRPQMSNCWCSRLTNIKPLEILDLHVPSENEFCGNISLYIVLMPLIIACMLPMMGKSTDVFKPEYLIPQLIMEWIIKNKKLGVYYTTSHLTAKTRKDFNYPDDKYNNIAIPIKSPLMDVAMNCPTLAQMFKITNPANYEIETLKYGEGLKWYNIDEDPVEENYKTSSFWTLESYLCDENKHKLHTLS